MNERISNFIRFAVAALEINSAACAVAPAQTDITNCSRQGEVRPYEIYDARTVTAAWTTRVYLPRGENVETTGIATIAIEPGFLQSNTGMFENIYIPKSTPRQYLGTSLYREVISRNLYLEGSFGSSPELTTHTWRAVLDSLDSIDFSRCHVLRVDWENGKLKEVRFDKLSIPIHRKSEANVTL